MMYQLLRIFSVVVLLQATLFALNVRDFGAKGDGVTDDTDAIQRCMDQAESNEFNVLAGYSKELGWSGHGGHGTSGEVFLPKGIYRLTRPLVNDSRHFMLRGEEGTTLVGAPGQDILYLHCIGRAIVEKVHFQGGRIQVNIFTNNNDMTMIRLDGCSFTDPELESIRAYNAKAKEWRGIPTYLVNRDGTALPQLAPNPEYETSPGLLPNSTLFTIVNCHFTGSATFISGGSDQFVVENSDFERIGGTLPIFHCTGQSNFRNLNAVYKNPVPGGPEYWMYRGPYGNREEAEMGCDVLAMENCKFVCEDGAKLGIMRSARKAAYYHSVLRLNRCQLKLGGTPVVSIAPDTSIGIIEFQDNVNLDDKVVPLVVFEKVPTWEDFETKIRYKWFDFAAVTTQYKCLSRGNQGFDERLPEVLRPFFCEPLPANELAKSVIESRPADAWPQEKDYTGKTIRPDFSQGVSDTKALKIAFGQAQKGDCVILPGRRLAVDEPLLVNAGVEITAEGTAMLHAVDEKDLLCLLVLTGNGDSLIRNIAFANGKHAVQILSKSSRHAFQNCLFLAQTQTAVQAENRPESILISDCLFFTHGGLQTDAIHTEIRKNWICNAPNMENRAFFNQYGDEMLIECNLFVPIMPRVNISDFKPKPEYADKKIGNNLRWVDNHNGKLMFNCSRLGGEFGGMTPAHLYGNHARLLFRGSYCWFGNCYTKQCMAYCVDLPESILFQSIIFNGESWLGNDYPYNLTIYSEKNKKDIPKAIIPQAKSSAITFYK